METLTLWILVSVYGTSLLSGVFGMAGGMVLMGIYTAILPVEQAMVLHGFTQLAANVIRWGLHRGRTDWRGVGLYLVGALLATLLLGMVAFVPDKATVLLVLGAVPFAGLLLPDWRCLRFSRPEGAVVCGLTVTGVQLLAGVAGPLLDQFFLHSNGSKEELIATKSILTSLSHFLKLVYFLRMVETDTLGVQPALLMAVLISAWLGTRSGAALLARLSERRFRQVTQGLVLVMGGVYLAQGFVALAGR